MKKDASPQAVDDLRAEYTRSDFGKLVRGKYAARLAAETNDHCTSHKALHTEAPESRG